MTEWTVNNKLNDWYEKQYHIKLPKKFETKSRLYFSLTDFVYLPFIPSGSTGLITADSLVFRVVALPSIDGGWVIEEATILQSPDSPTQPIVVDDRIEA